MVSMPGLLDQSGRSEQLGQDGEPLASGQL